MTAREQRISSKQALTMGCSPSSQHAGCRRQRTTHRCRRPHITLVCRLQRISVDCLRQHTTQVCFLLLTADCPRQRLTLECRRQQVRPACRPSQVSHGCGRGEQALRFQGQLWSPFVSGSAASRGRCSRTKVLDMSELSDSGFQVQNELKDPPTF